MALPAWLDIDARPAETIDSFVYGVNQAVWAVEMVTLGFTHAQPTMAEVWAVGFTLRLSS